MVGPRRLWDQLEDSIYMYVPADCMRAAEFSGEGALGH